jgi:hypothetical protein
LLVYEIENSKRKDVHIESKQGTRLFTITKDKALRIKTRNVGLVPIIVSGKLSRLPKNKKGLIQILQVDDSGRPSGGLTFEVRSKVK